MMIVGWSEAVDRAVSVHESEVAKPPVSNATGVKMMP